MIRIGVDTGGTFTDFVSLGSEGLRVHKVRSTPDDPSRAIIAGIAELAGDLRGLDVVHGSTVATNAVLERRGARLALVATAGFEDVLRIGRQTRPELYNLDVDERQPLVDPALTFALDERICADGTVIKPLDRNEVIQIAHRLREAEVAAVAVCLLHSYANPAHELLVTALLREHGFSVSASHEVLREYREFERWSTTAVNAYVTPLMAGYLSVLEANLRESRLRIMQSNGGVISAATARARSVTTILSGPAGGAVGAKAVADAAGYARIITFDMGGTSSDVSLIDGKLGTTTESRVGDFPVRLPIIDIHTVGAGGGSIAFVDAGGALRVGPRSAGADPGPACYGNGTELTVTDANLLLGRLDEQYFLGGRMALDRERARTAARTLATKLSLSETEVAEGVIRVANANMERAIRVVSVQRGFDPREFALLAFGGAGGMHACELAAGLDMSTVIVPRHAGVLSALGMLLADVTRDYSQTVLRRSDDTSTLEIEAMFGPLVARAAMELSTEDFSESQVRIVQSLDVRYVGQSYEITVPFTDRYREAFDDAHARSYGYANPLRPTEIVNLRVTAIGITEKPHLPSVVVDDAIGATARRVADALFDGRLVPTSFYHWEALAPGSIGDGPAVVGGGEATAVVPPGFQFRIDEFGNLVATRMVARHDRPTDALETVAR
ncbi:MAG: hydantoinase/oxoprolinase family protein [Acidobacteria bacterium]|nr:hydantoinase/oxoprolinase family protein [Acidobacteriota bacterium]